MRDCWAFTFVLPGGDVTIGALVLLQVLVAGLSVSDAVTTFTRMVEAK